MNVTYRIIDPSTGKIRGQGLYNNKRAVDRKHFERLSAQAYAAGHLIATMATGHQSSLFSGDAPTQVISSMVEAKPY